MYKNKEIDDVFKAIKIICEHYLSESYPGAPDPEEYIVAIQRAMRVYNNIYNDQHPENEEQEE